MYWSGVEWGGAYCTVISELWSSVVEWSVALCSGGCSLQKADVLLKSADFLAHSTRQEI